MDDASLCQNDLLSIPMVRIWLCYFSLTSTNLTSSPVSWSLLLAMTCGLGRSSPFLFADLGVFHNDVLERVLRCFSLGVHQHLCLLEMKTTMRRPALVDGICPHNLWSFSLTSSGVHPDWRKCGYYYISVSLELSRPPCCVNLGRKLYNKPFFYWFLLR